MQSPVARMLSALGHEVALFADGSGKGKDHFSQQQLSTEVPKGLSTLHSALENASLAFIGTSTTANMLEYAAATLAHEMDVPVVYGADSILTHTAPPWKYQKSGHWFALDQCHANHIFRAHPNAGISIVGQPAYDAALDLIPSMDKLRRQSREELEITDRTVAVFWSRGNTELLDEEIDGVCAAVETLGSKFAPSALIACWHPKLADVVGADAAQQAQTRVSDACAHAGVTLLPRPSKPTEIISMSGDVILTIGSNELQKALLLGIPAVLMLGPAGTTWYRQYGIDPKSDLAEVVTGRAIPVHHPSEMANRLNQALALPITPADPMMPRATTKVAERLIELAR